MRAGDHDFHVEDVRQEDGKVTVTYSWADAHGRRLESGQVLRLREGQIVDMEDVRHGSTGRRVAKLFERGPS